MFQLGSPAPMSAFAAPPPQGPPPPPPQGPPPVPPPPMLAAPSSSGGGPQKSRSSRTVTSSSLGSILSKLAPGPIPDSMFQPPRSGKGASRPTPLALRQQQVQTPPSPQADSPNFFAKVVNNLKGVPLNAPLEVFEQAIEAATSKTGTF